MSSIAFLTLLPVAKAYPAILSFLNVLREIFYNIDNSCLILPECNKTWLIQLSFCILVISFNIFIFVNSIIVIPYYSCITYIERLLLYMHLGSKINWIELSCGHFHKTFFVVIYACRGVTRVETQGNAPMTA